MEQKEKIESSKEVILEREINLCFARLADAGVLSIDQLNFLLFGPRKYLGICTFLVVHEILQRIAEGTLKRWDFDIWDLRWRNELDEKASEFIYTLNPTSKLLVRKRGALSRIVRTYREHCMKTVALFKDKIYSAQSRDELIKIKDEIVALGMFLEINDKIMHNPSWLDSKKLFRAYRETLSLFDQS